MKIQFIKSLLNLLAYYFDSVSVVDKKMIRNIIEGMLAVLKD